MTVEELDIVVQASVEQALTEFKKIVPQLKKTIKQVEDGLSNVNAKGVSNKVQQAVQQVKQKISEVKNTGVDKQLQTQFDKAGASVQKYQAELDQVKDKLRQVYAEMDNIQANTWKAYTPDGVELGNKAIEPAVNNDLASNKQYQNLSKQASKLEEQIVSINAKLNTTKQEYGQISGQIQQATGKQNIWSNAVNKVRTAIAGIKKNISSTGGAFESVTNIADKVRNGCSQIFKVTSRIVTKIKQIGTGFKQGLGHVLRYAGALFSLQTIYSTLSSSASAWLSSQNSQAQQLNANIEYMKYAMGSALAPVIQFVVNLVYKLMKAIQSVAYALTGVNIFANASADAYSSMADSAKEANKQTKQLTGVHSEINNIQSNDSGTTGSGENIEPSFDLSKVEGINSSIIDAIKNSNWYEIGATIGTKLNEALEKIPWDKIKKTAGKIGKNIAEFLNTNIETTDWELVGKTLGESINTIVELGYNFVKTFNWDSFGKSIADGINGAIESIDWKKTSNTISTGIADALKTASSTLENLDWEELANSWLDTLEGINWEDITANLSETIGAVIGGIVQFIKTTFVNSFTKKSNEWEQIFTYFKEQGYSTIGWFFAGIFYKIGEAAYWVKDNILTPLVDGFKKAFGINSPSTVFYELGTYITEGLYNGIQSLVNKIKEIWENLKNIATNIFNNIKEIISNIFDNIKNTTMNIWNNITNTIKNAVDTIKEKISSTFQTAYNNITNVFKKIPTFFSEIWNKVKNTFSKLGINISNAIGSSVKSGMNGVISMIQSTINSAIRLINGAIGLINKIPGVSIGTISTISLPRLAKGAVLKVPTVAEMAEYPGASTNPEIVTPQNIMEETFDRVLARYQNEDNTPIYLTVNVGNAKLGQILLDDLRNMKRRSGKGIEALVGG